MKILVGYRVNDRNLLPLAAKHAKAFGHEVLVVTSLIGDECKNQDHIMAAEQELDYAKSFFEDQDIPCETFLVARGQTTGEVLVSFAIEKGAEQIIIGVKKKSQIGKLIFGSTAQYVILNAPCSVTTIQLR